jgi:preprotein translocase SecE subunit
MMSPLTVKEKEKPMATDVISPSADEPGDRKPPQRAHRESGSGFFTILKSGQGYWTRLGTAIAAGLIILFTSYFIYEQLRVWPALLDNNGKPRPGLVWGVIGGFVAASSLLAWHLMNKPANVDFLIATDSEMKKVNWTSRKDLIGSTKVVIAFMFIIAALLFVIDVVFGYVFYFIRVLKTPPF